MTFSVSSTRPDEQAREFSDDASFEIKDSGVLVIHEPGKRTFASPAAWAWVEEQVPPSAYADLGPTF